MTHKDKPILAFGTSRMMKFRIHSPVIMHKRLFLHTETAFYTSKEPGLCLEFLQWISGEIISDIVTPVRLTQRFRIRCQLKRYFPVEANQFNFRGNVCLCCVHILCQLIDYYFLKEIIYFHQIHTWAERLLDKSYRTRSWLCGKLLSGSIINTY